MKTTTHNATAASPAPPSPANTKRAAKTTTRLLQAVATASALGLSSGCATIISPTSHDVPIVSEPNGARLTVKRRDGVVIAERTTPCFVRLETGFAPFTPASYQFTLSKEGYRTEEWKLDATFNSAYVGNLFFGGLLGFLIVDPISGAMWELDGSPITKTLLPARHPAPAPTPTPGRSSYTPTPTAPPPALVTTPAARPAPAQPRYVSLEEPPAPPPPPAPKFITLTDSTFDAAIKSGLVFVDFTTPAAPEHKALLEELSTTLGKTVTIASINLAANRAKIKPYSIKNVPTFILFKDGQPITTVVGLRPAKFLAEVIRNAE